MSGGSKRILVYDAFSNTGDLLLGILYVDVIRGEETYSFEYDSDWLRSTGMKLNLDPALMPFSGRQFPQGKSIFATMPLS